MLRCGELAPRKNLESPTATADAMRLRHKVGVFRMDNPVLVSETRGDN